MQAMPIAGAVTVLALVGRWAKSSQAAPCLCANGLIGAIGGPLATLAGWPFLARTAGFTLDLARYALDALALNMMAVIGGVAGLVAHASARGVRMMTLWNVARAFLLDRTAAGVRRVTLVAQAARQLVARQGKRLLPCRHGR